MCKYCDAVFSAGGWEIAAKFATPLIAAFVAYITYMQWKVNRATIREKLFDRRFEVFRETQRFLTRISENLSFTQTELGLFTDAYQRSCFLFDSELSKYLKSVRNKALELDCANSLMDAPGEVENRLQHIRTRHDNGVWLNAQLDVIFVKFHTYLGFSKDS
jgi:hypothetical protein